MADILDHPNKKLSSVEKSRRIKDGIAQSQKRGSGRGTASSNAIKKRQEAAALKRQKIECYEHLKTVLEDKFGVSIKDEEALVLLVHYITLALDQGKG